MKGNPEGWLRAQLKQQYPPSRGWLVERLVSDFGCDHPAAEKLVNDVTKLAIPEQGQ